MKNLKETYSTWQNLRANYRNIKYCNNIRIAFIVCYIKDVIFIVRNLKKVSRKYKQSYFSIFYNSFFKYPLLGFIPSQFFMYKLFKNSYKKYLNFLCLISIIKVNKWNFLMVGNKLKFKTMVKDLLPQSNLVASYDYDNGKIIHYNKPTNGKVVIKPHRGGGGRGIKIVKVEDYMKVLNSYKTNCIVEDFIEQHDFLNHIFSDSLNTIRVVTMKNGGTPEVVMAVLKVGRSSTNNMDHLQHGSIGIELDLKTGELLKGISKFKYFEEGEYKSHPETGYVFYKKKLPFFKEVKKIAIKAHGLVPSLELIGWDIAVTNEGPYVVEGNRIPGLSLIQTFEPLKGKLANTLKM